MDVKIDDEFEKLIPPLTADEYKQLEDNIIERGCRDAVVVWQETGILVDGHNRYHICKDNDIPFKVIEESFTDRDDVKAYIIKNQFGRRNLSAFQRSELAIVLKPLIEKEAKERQGKRNDLNIEQKSAQGSDTPHSEKGKTNDKLAKIAGVSHDTIHKTEIIKEEGTEEQIERARKGGKGNSVNAIYNEIRGKKKRDKPVASPDDEEPQEPEEDAPDGPDTDDTVNGPEDMGLPNPIIPPLPDDQYSQFNAPDHPDTSGITHTFIKEADGKEYMQWTENNAELLDTDRWQMEQAQPGMVKRQPLYTDLPPKLSSFMEEFESIRRAFTDNIVNAFELERPEILKDRENWPALRGMFRKMIYTLNLLEDRYLTDKE